MEINLEDFDDKIKYAPGTGHICRGSGACENRQFDEKKKDCQECLEDFYQAMKGIGVP